MNANILVAPELLRRYYKCNVLRFQQFVKERRIFATFNLLHLGQRIEKNGEGAWGFTVKAPQRLKQSLR